MENKIDNDGIVVVEEGKFRGKLEQDSPETSTAAVVTSLSLHHHLAQVDKIVDFFTTNEELVGRFRICSSRPCPLPVKRNSSSNISNSSGGCEEGGNLQQQQAIIFKIRTTSPYSCWVRPIYGLMRPNVIAWVEVKCELKANSLAELVKNMKEFLVEICPVPGAIHTMTSDLYTNEVHSNLPELLNIWEVVEQELKENQQQLQGFVKEFYRVSCRFQRSSLSSSLQPFLECMTAQQQEDDMWQDYINKDNNSEAEAKNNNNNVETFHWNPFNSVQAHDEHFYLAREFPCSFADIQAEKKSSTGVHNNRLRWKEQCRRDDHDEDFANKSRIASRCCSGNCGAVRQLCCLVFVLAILLFVLLVYIGYSQFYHYSYYCNNNNITNSNNDDVKNS